LTRKFCFFKWATFAARKAAKQGQLGEIRMTPESSGNN